MTSANLSFDAPVFKRECEKILENFNKLVKATGPNQPGVLQDVYADKMLVSVKLVLEASRALQRRAALSDVERRRAVPDDS